MMPKIYQEIEESVAAGIPPQYIAANLINRGWPKDLVNKAVHAWLLVHGRLQRKTSFKLWLKKYKARALPATITIIIISVISSSILLLQPWPTKILVDSGFGNIKAPGPLAPYSHTPTLILITSLLTVAIFLVGILFGTIRDYLVLRLGFWLNRGIKEESFRHILHLPLYHQKRLAKGDYIYRQNILTNSLSDLVLDTTAQIFQSIIMVIGIFLIMLKFNQRLAFISVVVVPFLFILIRLFGPKLSRISNELTQVASKTSTLVTESVDNAETVQAFTLEEKQIAKANALWRHNYRLSLRGLMWGRFYRLSNSLLIILGTSAVMYFGGTAALHGQMTLGQLLIFMTYMGYLLGPVEAIATEIAARNQKMVDVSRVYEVLTDHEGIERLRKSSHMPFVRGAIEFQSVTYRYGATRVLNNVSLRIPAGQKVGIIGPSGGGKSTFLKLLPLFIEPTRGRVLIDNVDIQSVSLQDLRRHIVWISQTPQLFNESILENLQDGSVTRTVNQQEVDQATMAANASEFINKLPMGVNSLAGESGNSLSGGQKQRIAIARGLIKHAPIVCMDEPTAALDSRSENQIRNSISQLISGKTVLMVTHRKALLSLMDVIYVMEGGQLHNIDEFGGLEAYLQRIEDMEGTNTEQESVQREREAEADNLIERLEAENQQLTDKISELAQQEAEPAQVNDGTIYIKH